MRLRRNQAGFTAVEVLVAVTTTTIVVIVIANFMMHSVRTSTLETAKADMLHEVQLTLDAVAMDVRMSGNADQNNRNPDANSPVPSNQFGWASNSSTLVLARAATTTGGSIIFSDPANYVTTKNNVVYFVSGGTLYKRIIAASASGNSAKTSCPADKATASCPADRVLLHNVSEFQVTYVDGDDHSVSPTNARSVEIKLTASRTKVKQAQQVSHTTRMVFRND
ncbi:MAG TPA: prepilin-type N-terminal cleavage/methylation domain-containing protein [Candidatus Saccharimonadales bacterium]